MFSKLKWVKVNFCCSLGVRGLENTLKIMEEGNSWETYDPMPAIKKWNIGKVRNATEEKDHVATSPVILLKQMLNLKVTMTVKMRKIVFLKMGTNKDTCFLLITINIHIFWQLNVQFIIMLGCTKRSYCILLSSYFQRSFIKIVLIIFTDLFIECC